MRFPSHDAQFLRTRRVVYGIRMRERFGPKSLAPLYREFFGARFHGELSPFSLRSFVDDLQVAEFVKEHLVEEKPPNRQERPLATAPGAEQLGRPPLHQEARQAHSWREGTESDFAPPAVDVSQHS